MPLGSCRRCGSPSRSTPTIIGNCYDGLPDEACGLLIGPLGVRRHADRRDLARVAVSRTPTRRRAPTPSTPATCSPPGVTAEARGHEIVGVWHSHTHTDAYPSPTDVRQAVDPAWWYPIVSLRDDAPVLRAYRIVDESITESRDRRSAGSEPRGILSAEVGL